MGDLGAAGLEAGHGRHAGIVQAKGLDALGLDQAGARALAQGLRHEGTAIPDAFDYAQVRGLSAEVLQKLQQVRPQTVGQAQRIPGVTPAAISLLLVHLERARRERAA